MFEMLDLSKMDSLLVSIHVPPFWQNGGKSIQSHKFPGFFSNLQVSGILFWKYQRSALPYQKLSFGTVRNWMVNILFFLISEWRGVDWLSGANRERLLRTKDTVTSDNVSFVFWQYLTVHAVSCMYAVHVSPFGL